ncbi:MAG TPA: hypothetical protein VFS21_19795 [Roseiflexaceae bacterium]|nr:hypothetical protein [Roseiflexaceae bacterium]
MSYPRRTLLLSGLLLAALLWPAQALAGTCSGGLVPDLGACVDSTNYSFWRGVAISLWQLDRLLLIAAYQLDQIRWWLVATVFQAASTQITAALGPYIAPLGGLALTIALLAIIAQPATGRPVVGNIRQILVLLILAPTLMVQVGPGLAALEQIRVEIASALFGDLSVRAPSALFGPSASDADMLPARPLYPASCGGSQVRRPGATGLTTADAAAAALWADAIDIHCPRQRANPALPALWFEPAPAGAGYAYAGDLGDVDSAQQRSTFIAGIQTATTRAALGLILCGLAVLDRAIQLIFTLCLVALFVGVPVTLLYAFFQDSFAGIAQLISAAAGILKVSWGVSFLLNLVATCLLAATALRDGAAVIGFGGAALLLVVWLGFVALKALGDCLGALSGSLGEASGLDARQPVQAAQSAASAVAGTAVSVAGGVATGGASMALSGFAAAASGANAEYSLGAALSGSKPFAQAGALASAMGLLSPEMEQGLYTGSVMGRGDLLSMRTQRQVRADQARYAGTGLSAPDDAYPTVEDAAEQHAQRVDRRQEARIKRATTPEREVWEASRRMTEVAKHNWDAAKATSDASVAAGEPPEAQAAKAQRANQFAQVYQAASAIEQGHRQDYQQAVMRQAGTLGIHQTVAQEIWLQLHPESVTVQPPTVHSPAGLPGSGGSGAPPALPDGGGDPLPPSSPPPAPAPIPARPRPSAPAGPARTQPEEEQP